MKVHIIWLDKLPHPLMVDKVLIQITNQDLSKILHNNL